MIVPGALLLRRRKLSSCCADEYHVSPVRVVLAGQQRRERSTQAHGEAALQSRFVLCHVIWVLGHPAKAYSLSNCHLAFMFGIH